MEEKIKTDRKKFINDFDESYKVYLESKKDYFYVKLLFEHFCQNNKEVKDDIKIIKLQNIVNTYRANKNHDFNLDKYKTCEFFWRNLNLYILSNLAFVSESLIKKKKNDYEKDLDKIIDKHIINCEKIVNDLEIGNSKINRDKTISKSISYLKDLARDIKEGKI
tara:strand:+ start:728 stop:1219 length:492 start_codon:yes stop_codon:yes gene_type:complete